MEEAEILNKERVFGEKAEIKKKKKLRYTQAGVVDDHSQDCVKMMSLQLLLLS